MTLETRARAAARDIHRVMETVETSANSGWLTPGERFARFRTRKDRNRAIGTIALVIVGILAISLSGLSMVRDTGGEKPVGTGPPPVPTPVGTVTITSEGCTLDGLTDPSAGAYKIEVLNETDGVKGVVVFKIANDARFDRMLTFVERVRPRFGNPAHGPGHASEDARRVSRFFEYASTSETDVDAHGSLVMQGAFDPGTYGIQCLGRGSERDSPSHFVGPIEVPIG